MVTGIEGLKISNLESSQEGGGWASTLGLEILLEQSSSIGTITEAVRHSSKVLGNLV